MTTTAQITIYNKLIIIISLVWNIIAADKNFMPMQQGDVKETYADCKLLYELTGFEPKTSIREGIKQFCDWYSMYYEKI